MRIYFDTSAFAKRYVNEPGTAEVLEWCDKATELALSIIAIPELISALCRLRREGSITANQYRRAKTDLLSDITDALICDTTPQVIQHSVRALEAHPLRGMDAIHLGAAITCSADLFVSADSRQCVAAKALGLRAVAIS